MASKYIPLGPFTYTAAGDLGAHRDPMLCNELLLRNKVGQINVRGFHMPGKGFIFGQPTDKREFTVGDALRGWSGCFGIHKDKPKKQPGRDFMALNRAAVSAGLASTKEHYDYRVTHDFRLKPPPDAKSRTIKFPANMVFGRPGRPSTPMFDILEHRYQDRWLRQRYNQKEAEESKQSKKKNQLMHYDTRAVNLRTYNNPVPDQPLWHLPRFANSAKPHLQTFRTSKAKADAWMNFDLDHVSRKGVLGQGIYEAAKN